MNVHEKNVGSNLNKLIVSCLFVLFAFFWGINTYNNMNLSSVLSSNSSFNKTELINNALFKQFNSESGDLVRRVFTGVNEMPFFDFLLVEDANNNLVAILLDSKMVFFNVLSEFFPDILLFFPVFALNEIKNIIFIIISVTVLKTALQTTKLKYNDFELLLAYILSLIWKGFSYSRKEFVFLKNSSSL